jgi:AraC-like DNA-binding protein
MRFDNWINLLRNSLWPVTDWSGISEDFSVDLQEAQLGCLTTAVETMSGAPRARRTRRDVDCSAESFYGLFLVDTPSYWAHNGHCQYLLPGDVMLIGQGEHDSYMVVSGFQSNIIKLPAHWLESWLPDPNAVVGRAISKDSRWGRVLSPMVSQLTPAYVVAPPLPHAVFVDQLGTTLALIAGEPKAKARPDLLNNILNSIRERCREPQLTAADVATSLDVPPPILHRALGTKELTFASQLIDARISVALQMLSSPSCARMTTAEIARQAGFMSESYFSRVVRKRTGHTPLELGRSSRARGPILAAEGAGDTPTARRSTRSR